MPATYFLTLALAELSEIRACITSRYSADIKLGKMHCLWKFKGDGNETHAKAAQIPGIGFIPVLYSIHQEPDLVLDKPAQGREIGA